jgi:O-antigen/teichoic acid export membrane protein
VFRDFGISAYIKRAKELNPEMLRSAMGLLVTTSWATAVLIALLAPAIGRFYGEPRVVEVVHVLALGFVFIPFGSITEARLNRSFAVIRMAKASVVTTIVFVATSISLAHLGFGHMTMAWANLVNIITTGVAYHWVAEDRRFYLPSTKGWKNMLGFGTGNLMTALLKAGDSALPDVALGRLGTATQVGLFSRANAVVNMVSTGINPTVQFFALPYLAQVHHSDGTVAREFRRANSIVLSFLLPALIWIAIMSAEIINVLFGPQWVGSVPAVPWLCAAFAASSLFVLTTPAVTGIGKPYAATIPLFIGLVAKAVAIYLFYDGTLSSFSRAIFIGQLAAVPVFLWVNHYYLKVDTQQWLMDVLRVVLPATVAAFALLALTKSTIFEGPNLVRLLLSAVVFGATLLLGYIASPLPIRNELFRISETLRSRWAERRSR